MQSVFGFLELRTGNILIGLLSVIQSIAIILAGSASYAESEFSDFHLTWIGMSSMLLIASLLFLKGVGDILALQICDLAFYGSVIELPGFKLSTLMIPWMIVMVPYILWLVGAAVWTAVNPRMMDPVTSTLMFAFALVEVYFLVCGFYYHRLLVREH